MERAFSSLQLSSRIGAITATNGAKSNFIICAMAPKSEYAATAASGSSVCAKNFGLGIKMPFKYHVKYPHLKDRVA